MEDLSNIDSYKDSRNKYVTVSDAARHLRVCRNRFMMPAGKMKSNI